MPSESKRRAFDPISYGRQHISKADVDTVNKVLVSDYLTLGPEIDKFEKAFYNNYVGSKYAVAVANGTAALHLCMLGLNVDQNSKFVTTPITFSAFTNCVRCCGGEVTFADIIPDVLASLCSLHLQMKARLCN
ncbi:MAG: DegT/DnrJ/EryC1/StrS family aminotransferase [Balneolaceae bacterium]|nr:DegT/DnrJ/EryC1/StrS family aminotransferase [Balneolaceae bacterium]